MCRGYKGAGAILGGEEPWRLPAGHPSLPPAHSLRCLGARGGIPHPQMLRAPGAQSGHRLH